MVTVERHIKLYKVGSQEFPYYENDLFAYLGLIGYTNVLFNREVVRMKNISFRVLGDPKNKEIISSESNSWPNRNEGFSHIVGYSNRGIDGRTDETFRELFRKWLISAPLYDYKIVVCEESVYDGVYDFLTKEGESWIRKFRVDGFGGRIVTENDVTLNLIIEKEINE